ncbi:hypothetical protein AX17_003230 [Amanita inopinata Kibby_2008]|nr:hypothetical protein AX17_003230 [Amanita inopinata Kibby_2008]
MDPDSLASAFSRILSPEMIDEVREESHRDMTYTGGSLRLIPPDPNQDDINPIKFKNLRAEGMKPRFPPLEVLPCANIEVSKYRVCPNPGKMACSQCRLSLTSMQECQKNHWKQHKRDCKNPMMSTDWKPARDGHGPIFVSDGEEWDSLFKGVSLWGNMPAIDIINLAANEKDPTKDFSLAFVASGDLRNVVMTINSLPENYSGQLNILLNDHNLPVVFRNIVLLFILGSTEDQSLAADVALHFWYSAFLPAVYRTRISALTTAFLSKLYDIHPLGPLSNLQCFVPTNVKEYFSHLASSSFAVAEAREEYDRVRNNPSRGDYRDRMYLLLRPSHRVAFKVFRLFGLILPFGALNAHFNVPNASLFSLNRKWLQTDFADPLEGWDVDAVIRVGKAHGATAEDIYGCLYFFLTHELRTFARRLRQFRISFKITNLDACILSEMIKGNELSELINLPSTRFDRIEVSNIFDANYVGLRRVLMCWAPLLRQSSAAAIVGYFMNWAMQHREGRAHNADRETYSKVLQRLLEEGRVPGFTQCNGQRPSMDSIQASLAGTPDYVESLCDNSEPFSRFLAKQGLKRVLTETKLVLREKHTIVPHRIRVPLSASPDELPHFKDDEDWYRLHELSSFSFTERYVEFIRA